MSEAWTWRYKVICTRCGWDTGVQERTFDRLRLDGYGDMGPVETLEAEGLRCPQCDDRLLVERAEPQAPSTAASRTVRRQRQRREVVVLRGYPANTN